jgi:hypothetical protein
MAIDVRENGHPRRCEFPDCDYVIGMFTGKGSGWNATSEARSLRNGNGDTFYFCETHFKFLGRHGVSFLHSGADSLRAQIQYLVDDLGCVGHLWSLYRTVIGIHHSLHETEDVVLQQIDDYTDDLDHVWEYNQYSAILGREVSEDDNCHGNL